MVEPILAELGIQDENAGAHDGLNAVQSAGAPLESSSPIDGRRLARVIQADAAAYERIMAGAARAFSSWRLLPAPRRGEIVREIAGVLRDHKAALGRLVTLEMGKILAEGEGEVQEMIDVADYAVGLSRQLYGKTMHSERPLHRMYEQWHPLGNVGIITAFNFPVAVWAWNAMIAAVCGDVMVWKPSELTPLTAVAVHNLIQPVVAKHGIPGVFNMVAGSGNELGERIAADRRIPLVSATGSCRMGRRVGEVVARRLGRTLLELGGNNAIVVLDDADLDMTVRAVLFGAVGTAGQRCTSTRRLLIQKPVKERLVRSLVDAYRSVRIGDPLEPATLMGPLVHQGAVDAMQAALARAVKEGGRVISGGKPIARPGHYVEPALVEAHPDMTIWKEETFAPILYLFEIEDLEEGLRLHNAVDQGLSSAVFTRDLRRAEQFLSAAGSDCGIANVNIGTSGAEIGGAFGGEKDTGGGRESGSDSWKAYMRRQTSTINFSAALPLAQGVQFDI